MCSSLIICLSIWMLFSFVCHQQGFRLVPYECKGHAKLSSLPFLSHTICIGKIDFQGIMLACTFISFRQNRGSTRCIVDVCLSVCGHHPEQIYLSFILTLDILKNRDRCDCELVALISPTWTHTSKLQTHTHKLRSYFRCKCVSRQCEWRGGIISI